MPPLSSSALYFHPTLSSCLSAVRFPLFVFASVADLAVATCSASVVSLALSLRCCSPCRCQERWAGRKPWQVSFCRAPSSPLPACPGMGAFHWWTHDVSVCFVVCLCAYVRVVAAAQSQNWPSRIGGGGSCPLTLFCRGRCSPHSPPLSLLTLGFVPLPCAYSWWYVLMICCVWIP